MQDTIPERPSLDDKKQQEEVTTSSDDEKRAGCDLGAGAANKVIDQCPHKDRKYYAKVSRNLNE